MLSKTRSRSKLPKPKRKPLRRQYEDFLQKRGSLERGGDIAKKTPKKWPRRKQTQRKSKFHAQDNPLKIYKAKHTKEGVKVYAEEFRKLRLSNPTDAEERFSELLSICEASFEREKILYYANGIKFIIVDYFIERHNVAIEIDGEGHKLQAGYDGGRDAYLGTIGIRTIRFTNKEVLRTPEIVLAKVREMLK